ncbi:heteroglycan glucosidase 1 [Forsythia ovata]|uniref:Heteroglycan glucosidase 1 n=1 Tax=Forsythia ovata TaxID=205694 RepID=A0ABD1RPP6_9LAMI
MMEQDIVLVILFVVLLQTDSSLKGKFLLAGFLDVQSAENGHSFGGLSDATPKLFGRWMDVGALFPFCRGHSETDTIDHEPWSFREEDFPSLYLKGGSIIPLAPPYQHVDEANPTDDISLLVALDEHGKAEGFLFEDDGNGYEYIKGVYLVTTYVAELQSSLGTLTVLKTEGSWKRPNRHLHVQLLLGIGAVLDAWGTDGEIPSKDDLTRLKLAGERQYRTKNNLDIVELQVMLTAESAKRIPDLDIVPGHKGSELSRTPVFGHMESKQMHQISNL